MWGKIGLFVLIVCVFAFSVFIHEIAHVVCGGIIGLKIVGFRIFNIIFILEHKIKVRFVHAPKSLGSCIFVPRSLKINWKRMMLMYGAGILTHTFISIISLIGIFRFYGTPSDKYYGMFFMINFPLMLINSAPYCYEDRASDGYMIYQMCKYRRDIESYIELMCITGNVFLGNFDAIENIFKVPTDIQNIADFRLYMWKAYFLMEKKKNNEAKQIFFDLYHNKFMPECEVNYIKCELLWLAIMSGDKQLQEQLLTKEMKLYLSTTKNDYAALRVQYLLDDKQNSIHKYEKMHVELLRQDIYMGRVCIEEKLWTDTKLKVQCRKEAML